PPPLGNPLRLTAHPAFVVSLRPAASALARGPAYNYLSAGYPGASLLGCFGALLGRIGNSPCSFRHYNYLPAQIHPSGGRKRCFRTIFPSSTEIAGQPGGRRRAERPGQGR